MVMQETPVVNVVLGTAGHIDHGKTTLVKQLTGIDADRLQEEKDRGMTIDIGYAHMLVDQDLSLGVIDVPGHERFVRNMVAGATGFGLVVLVVAADDGVMPQTREHVEIMQILGLKRGICAITKIDLADEEMIELVEEDVREFVKGTFLEGSEIHRVSSVTGAGLADLRKAIERMVKEISGPSATGVFRLPIQRAFSAKGQGAVVTGVAVSGTVSVGEELEILPVAARVRIKAMEAYGRQIQTARAGHRTALNLAGVDYHAIHRGHVACEPGYLGSSPLITAKFRHLTSAKKPFKDQTQVVLHTGTFESAGKAYLLGRKQLAPGEEDFVQFRLDAPAPAAPGDRYIARYPSPPITAGGGIIVEAVDRKLKPRREWVLARLAERHDALPNPVSHVMHVLRTSGLNPLSHDDLAKAVLLPVREVAAIGERHKDEIVPVFRGEKMIHRANFDSAAAKIRDELAGYHKAHPMRVGMPKVDLRKAMDAEVRVFEEIIEKMESSGVLKSAGSFIALGEFAPTAAGGAEEAVAKCASMFKGAGFSPPERAAAEASLQAAPELAAEAVRHLLETGELVDIGGGMIFHSSVIASAEKLIRDRISADGKLVSAEFRDMVGTTRKFAIPLLEYFDRKGLTMRLDNIRVLREHGQKGPR